MHKNISVSNHLGQLKLKVTGSMLNVISKLFFTSLDIILLGFSTYDSESLLYGINKSTTQNSSFHQTIIKQSTHVFSGNAIVTTHNEIFENSTQLNNYTLINNTQSTTNELNNKENKNTNTKVASHTNITKSTTTVHYSPNFNSPLIFHEKHKTTVAFAPEVGINMSGMDHSTTSNALVNGYHLGGIFNISLSNHFAFQPGLIYINKGSVSFNTVNTNNTDLQTKQSDILHYAQIPLNFVYKTGEYTEGRFIVGFGPYVAYLFNIEQKSTDNNTNTSDGYVPGYLLKDEVRLPEPVLTRFDIGLNSFIGCEMPNGFYCKAGAEIGFINLQAHSNANFGFSLSTGVFIR